MKKPLAILLTLILFAASFACASASDAAQEAPAPTAEPVQMEMTNDEIAAMVIGTWENEDDMAGYGVTVDYYGESAANLLAEPGYYVITLKTHEFREDGTIRVTVRGRRLIGEFESLEDAMARADKCEYGDEVVVTDGEIGTYKVRRGYIRMEEVVGSGTWILPYHVICYDEDSFVTDIQFSDGLFYDRWLRFEE